MVNGGEALFKQMSRSGALASIGPDNFFLSGEWQGRTLAKAYREAQAWLGRSEGTD